MPQRFLRPGITTSRRFNALDWQAQSFFVRLLTIVDDYGRHEADPTLLASLCFPLNREITMTTVENICSQLLSNGLATFYAGPDEKRYLQLTRWKEVARSASRCPAPPDNICSQLQTSANKCLSPSPSPSPSPSVQREREDADAGKNGRADADARKASQLQWGQLHQAEQERILRARNGELDEGGREVLKKLRAAKKMLRHRQLHGDYTLLNLVEFGL